MWIIPYVILFFLILIPTTLFLLSRDQPKSVIHKVTMISIDPEYKNQFRPTQSTPNDPGNCINDLYNKFQSGMLDPEALREGVDRCFSLNPNSDGDNNSQIMPEPQPPSTNTPRFV